MNGDGDRRSRRSRLVSFTASYAIPSTARLRSQRPPALEMGGTLPPPRLVACAWHGIALQVEVVACRREASERASEDGQTGGQVVPPGSFGGTWTRWTRGRTRRRDVLTTRTDARTHARTDRGWKDEGTPRVMIVARPIGSAAAARQMDGRG